CSPYDAHADYSALFFFVRDALTALYAGDASYRPTLWCGLVHSMGGDLNWPQIQLDDTALDSFTMPRFLETASPLRWDDRTSFAVPAEMATAQLCENLKYRALLCYRSALRDKKSERCRSLLSFVKSDEIFWKTSFAPGKRFLFIGDSVTDGGRTYAGAGEWGNGFVRKIKDYLRCFYAFEGHTVINRGVSGNEAVHLSARLRDDCLALRPDLVTLMIGINDCGRRYDENRPTSAEQFEATLFALLTQLRESLPDTKIILMEPYLTDALPEQRVWREDLDPKRLAVQRLSLAFKTDFIALDGIFAAASAHRAPGYWSPDGVHPSDAGSSLIALHWLRAAGFESEGLL
ncbi:MAG: SGNH/GDSL hydrolase family protein, partial [Ruthenibacterium sp.]